MRFQADIGLAERRLIGQPPNHQPLHRRTGDRSRGLRRIIHGPPTSSHGENRRRVSAALFYLMVIQEWEDIYRFTRALRARGWTAQEIYVSHAPDGTSADFIYHLYQLDPPD